MKKCWNAAVAAILLGGSGGCRHCDCCESWYSPPPLPPAARPAGPASPVVLPADVPPDGTRPGTGAYGGT